MSNIITVLADEGSDVNRLDWLTLNRDTGRFRKTRLGEEEIDALALGVDGDNITISNPEIFKWSGWKGK